MIMNRAQTLEEIVKAHYANLTPSQKRLSDFILQNSYEAALLSSARLAERLSISEATVVRFAQTLGFDGYISLRGCRSLLRVRSGGLPRWCQNQQKMQERCGSWLRLYTSSIAAGQCL